MSLRASHFLLTGSVSLLVGCASSGLAPVIDRAPPQAVEMPTATASLPVVAPIEIKPGHYMVKKGDTLRGIALDHGQDYKDIAAWNSLDNPNLIKIGQVLRVVPPGEGESGVAEIRPIAPPARIESGKPVVADSLKREPKGGTQPYSDAAWAQLQKPMSVAAVPAPAPVKPAEPVAVKAATDIDWAWPTGNKVTTTFNDATNKGLDFDGKTGEPVLAAAAGKVTLVTSSLRGYGNLIVIKHNAAYLSVYAHNSKMLVSEGQSVAKGQKIAEIGSSDSDRPNLHFEIRREGKPVDPVKYLPQR